MYLKYKKSEKSNIYSWGGLLSFGWPCTWCSQSRIMVIGYISYAWMQSSLCSVLSYQSVYVQS